MAPPAVPLETYEITHNPFFERWTTPFGLPPFDPIRPEHFPPAFDRAIAEQRVEIAAIARNPQPPSFPNTIQAMERSGRLLSRVSKVFANLNASSTSEALEAVARAYAPKLAQHRMHIALDPELFRRVADLQARRDALKLAPDQHRLLAHLNQCARARCWRRRRRHACNRGAARHPPDAVRSERAA